MKGDDILARIWNDIQQAEMRRERDAAWADPLAHKNTLVFNSGVSPRYRFYAVKSRGRQTRYCWSTNKNAAGFYLFWVEVETKLAVKRTRFTSRRVRAHVKKLAFTRFLAHRDRLAQTQETKKS